MDFKQIVQQALEVRKQYQNLEIKKYGREWSREEIAQGFVGDVGDLMKLITAKSGVRDISGVDSKLSHKLSDCLWSIIILSNKYGIDLEKSFLETMNSLNEKIAQNE